MNNLSSLVLPYEAIQYTRRKLTARSEKLLEERLQEAEPTRDMPSLSVRANSYETFVEHDVASYRKLLELVAQIAGLNPQYQLFFRGQTNNWLDGKLVPTLYSGIWRDPLTSVRLDERRDTLNGAGNELVERLGDFYGRRSDAKVFLEQLRRNPLVRWALLQHYGICDTPLLDVTRSLQVACTFARLGAEHGHGYVYVLALPYQREAISIDDNEGMTVMSLLGVTPPSARRPLNQDGFLISTSEWWRYTADRSAGDAPRTVDRPNYYKRVMTVFRIPTGDEFYQDSGLSDFGNDWLCPKDDGFADILFQTGFAPKFW